MASWSDKALSEPVSICCTVAGGWTEEKTAMTQKTDRPNKFLENNFQKLSVSLASHNNASNRDLADNN